MGKHWSERDRADAKVPAWAAEGPRRGAGL